MTGLQAPGGAFSTIVCARGGGAVPVAPPWNRSGWAVAWLLIGALCPSGHRVWRSPARASSGAVEAVRASSPACITDGGGSPQTTRDPRGRDSSQAFNARRCHPHHDRRLMMGPHRPRRLPCRGDGPQCMASLSDMAGRSQALHPRPPCAAPPRALPAAGRGESRATTRPLATCRPPAACASSSGGGPEPPPGSARCGSASPWR